MDSLIEPTDSADLSRFGRFLRRLRVHSGMSQEYMAGTLGVPTATVAAWELGNSVPERVAIVVDLRQSLRVPDGSIDSLLEMAGYHPLSSLERRPEFREESLRMARILPRAVFHDLVSPGPGHRVLQVVYEPSFDPGFGWEIRELEDEFAVYRSSIETSLEGRPYLRGYSQLAVSSDKLKSYWEEVRELAADLSALDVPIAGFDGDLIQLALFAGFTTVRFTWWSHYPRAWQPLNEIAWDMIFAFREAPEIGAD